MKIFTLLLLCCTLSLCAQGVSNAEQALQKGQEGLALVKDAQYNQALVLFEQAQKLDPQSYIYPYQRAYVYYIIEDYPNAINILKPLLRYKESEDRVYILLGNCYDITHQQAQAIQTYKAGLQRFPTSGDLHAELGTLYLLQDDHASAARWFEKGIKADPRCASNYYRCAMVYCNTVESIWGIIYGEIFMNMERNSKRTAEISSLLYSTYNTRIHLQSDTAKYVNFGKEKLYAGKSHGNNRVSSFAVVMERLLLEASTPERNTGLAALHEIRSRWAALYKSKGYDTLYPNILLDYLERVRTAGHLEAYNYWVMVGGDDLGFQVWKLQHEEQWKNFAEWYAKNPLIISPARRFSKAQYK